MFVAWGQICPCGFHGIFIMYVASTVLRMAKGLHSVKDGIIARMDIFN